MEAKTVLLAEDSLVETELLRRSLVTGGYEVITAGNGRDALARIQAAPPALVMSDVRMPYMNGYQLCRAIKNDAALTHIPVILLSTLSEPQDIIAAIEAGADSYMVKPYSEVDLMDRLASLLATPLQRLDPQPQLELEYRGVRHRIASDARQMLNLLLSVYETTLTQNRQLMAVQTELRLLNDSLEARVQERSSQLTSSYRDTIQTLNRAAAYRDEQTGNHILRVARYCDLMAEELGMDSEFRDHLHYAIPLHDIGKIAIPDAVLLKPGGFNREEWQIMQMHAELGARMLEDGGSPYLSMGRDVAWCHHECWDGSGYPRGLQGEQIPLAARMMQLADVYDALRSARPYKQPFSHARAVEIILEGDGRTRPQQFDPALLACFRRTTERFEHTYAGLMGSATLTLS